MNRVKYLIFNAAAGCCFVYQTHTQLSWAWMNGNKRELKKRILIENSFFRVMVQCWEGKQEKQCEYSIYRCL